MFALHVQLRKMEQQASVLVDVNAKLKEKDMRHGMKAWEEVTKRTVRGEVMPDERRKVC